MGSNERSSDTVFKAMQDVRKELQHKTMVSTHIPRPHEEFCITNLSEEQLRAHLKNNGKRFSLDA